jgi:zinc protease
MNRRVLAVVVLGAALGLAQKPTSYKDLKYPALPQVHIPEPATFALSNGMRVFLLEDHELPLIQGSVLIHTGNLFDPPDKRGLSEVMADVLRSGGTKAKTGDQIDEELENIAGSVESGMDETSASVSFSGLKETSDSVLQIFKDVLTDPEFRQDKIDLVLSQLRSSIARRNDDAGGIPDRELMRLLYGRDTPYGWQIEYEHLDRIHRDDLAQFYRRYYFPRNMMLAVYGDFATGEMKDKLEKLLGGWTVEQPAVPAFPAVTAKPAPGVYLAEKADVTQTFFAMGELGGTFLDKDYAALQVAANILGSGFTSRLVSQIRTKLGYAYEIGAAWAAQYNHPGTFRISGSTKSQSTTETLEAINAELEKLRTSEVTPQELDTAKQAVLNSFVFFFDSPAKTLNRVLRYEYFGYPKDFLFQYQKAIVAVTRADVLRVAKEHLQPENLSIVAVGNPKDFGKPLTALGKINPLDLTIPEPKKEVAAAPAGDAASKERARQLLARAQQAMGGADRLAAIQDLTQSVEMVMEAGVGGMKIKQRNRYVAPGYFRQDQELPIGKMSAYTDGKTGWLITPQGRMAMPAAVLKQAQGEVFRHIFHLVMADRDSSAEVSAAGSNIVEITSAGGKVRLELDEATGLPVRESHQAPGMNGSPIDVAETYSDWRDAGGLKAPFKLTLEQGGRKLAEATVLEYKLNSGMKSEELSQTP